MHAKRIWKFVASFAICGFLLGAGATSAAPGDVSKSKGKVGPSQSHSKEAFLASLTTDDDGYCESNCCYAWFENCDGGSVSCSNSGCSFSCPNDGLRGSYTCSEQ
jgi:hypothetical protein